MVDFTPVDYDPFAAEKFANPAVKGAIEGAASLPRRAFEASETMRQGGGYDPGPVLEAATLPVGTGALTGVSMKAGEAALGSGAIRGRYEQALARGDISKAEYEGFMEALPPEESGAAGSRFADKAAARIELRAMTRVIDKFMQKQREWQDGGPPLTKAERALWVDAFGRKQAAQQYLTSTQPILIEVDHDPFSEGD